MTASRSLRYFTFLQGFNYYLKHRNAKEHTNVDYLFRTKNELIVNGKDKGIIYLHDRITKLNL